MPALGPYELIGRVSNQAEGIALNDLRAKLGDSNVAGDVTLALTAPRMRLAGKLTSQTVRLDQLQDAINCDTASRASASRECDTNAQFSLPLGPAIR